MRINKFKEFNESTESEETIKKRILEESGILDILYDLKDMSLEYLDVRHIREEDSLYKRIIFTVAIEKGSSIDDIFGGEYSFDSTDIEENIHWVDNIEPKDLLDEIKSINSHDDVSISITFAIIAGEYGDSEIMEDTYDVYTRISEMYPYIKFDTINPWDLN